MNVGGQDGAAEESRHAEHSCSMQAVVANVQIERIPVVVSKTRMQAKLDGEHLHAVLIQAASKARRMRCTM